MRKFDYSFLESGSVSTELLNLATSVATLRSESNLLQSNYRDTFEKLHEVAIIGSVKSSNAIEGVVATDERIRAIVSGNSKPLNHSEAEIAGYKDALKNIFESYENLDVTERLVKILHEMLMSYVPGEGGEYKKFNNDIVEITEAGERRVRFSPTMAEEVPAEMEQMMLAFREARANMNIDQLLLTACFVLDFLSIHPFLDGNGRISRLLSVLLLCQNGYDVVKYISFEEQIDKYKGYYYESLKESSVGWHENMNDYGPFMENFLAMVYSCYKELHLRFGAVGEVREKKSKAERIEAIVMNSLTPISKTDVQGILPDVSVTTIEAVLGKMVRAGKVEKVGEGRGTRYMRK